jgi:pimeloyl-ACP methyl ester carboxylesterase
VKKLLTLGVALAALATPLAVTGAAQASPAHAAASSGSRLTDAFYHPPQQLVRGPHGSVIWALPLHGVSAYDGASNWRVLYRSVTPQGRTVAVSGTVAIPHGRAPRGGWPVISWLHGTTGVADVCAPSRDSETGLAHDYLQVMHDNLQHWVDRGYAVVYTDYQGLGTDGEHSYLDGEAEARAAADMVRAGRQLAPGLSTRWVAYGHSQGGHAALFAAAQGNSWTPELHLLGAVGLAPGSQLSSFVPQIRNQPVDGVANFLPLIIRGVETTGVPIDGLLTPRAESLMSDADDRCIAQLKDPASWGSLKSNEVFRAGADFTAFDKALAANEPGALSPTVPVFLAQGDSDTTVLPAWTRALDIQLEGNGVDVTSDTYPGTDHRGVIAASYPDVSGWIDRLFDRS